MGRREVGSAGQVADEGFEVRGQVDRFKDRVGFAPLDDGDLWSQFAQQAVDDAGGGIERVPVGERGPGTRLARRKAACAPPRGCPRR